MYLLIFSSLLNIVLDMVFVICFRQGVRGVAGGDADRPGRFGGDLLFPSDAEAEGIRGGGSVWLLTICNAVHGEDRRSLHPPAVHRPYGHPSGPVGGCSFGSAALAGYSAGSRIESLSIVPMLAMGNAMSTFTAQNIGAGKLDRVKEGYKMCYVTVLTVGAGLCIMYQLFGGAFVSMFLESGGALPILWAFLT